MSIEYSKTGAERLSGTSIKGVLFDMDGVIIDTEKLYTRFWVEAGRALGYPMEIEHGLALRSLNHEDGERLFESWFGDASLHEKIRTKRIELMNDFIEANGVELKPGVVTLLDFLDSKHIPYCIATASPIDRVKAHLTSVGLADRFKFFVTAYDVKKGKPEPDIYLAAAKKIGVDPKLCIALEDSYNGLLAAHRAGVMPVMVPDQDQPDEKTWEILAGKADALGDLIELWEKQDFFIHIEGIPLHGKLEFPDGYDQKVSLVILTAGLTGYMTEPQIETAAKAILASGVACLRVELYGHGESGGDFQDHDIEIWTRELIKIFEIAEKWSWVSDIYLAGHSQGGLTVMLAAGALKDKVKGLILLSTATNIIDMCRTGNFFGRPFDTVHLPAYLHFWDDVYVTGNYLEVGRQLELEPAIAAYKGPVLLIHGSGDMEVPASCSENAAQKYVQSELVILPDDNHCYDLHRDMEGKAITRWLMKNEGSLIYG